MQDSPNFAMVRRMINNDALQTLRIVAGYSKSEMAVAAGWSLSYYSEVESGGKANVGPLKLRTLATALDERLGVGVVRVESTLRYAAPMAAAEAA